jgi:hypothetical protein
VSQPPTWHEPVMGRNESYIDMACIADGGMLSHMLMWLGLSHMAFEYVVMPLFSDC